MWTTFNYLLSHFEQRSSKGLDRIQYGRPSHTHFVRLYFHYSHMVMVRSFLPMESSNPCIPKGWASSVPSEDHTATKVEVGEDGAVDSVLQWTTLDTAP
jgi:hypothetical protein